MVLIAMATAKDEFILRRLKKTAPDSLWLGATMPRGGSDRRHLAGLNDLAERVGIPLLATNDALYATREQRPLHDVITCLRESTNLHTAGRLLRPNGARHLRPRQALRPLFRTCPEAVAERAKTLHRTAF